MRIARLQNIRWPRARFLRQRSLSALAGLGLALLTTTAATGCVVVKPYQREPLAERCMQSGFGIGTEARFRSHWEGSRSGLEGGYGEASGGCGCN